MFRSAIQRNPINKNILKISKQKQNGCIRWQSTVDQKSNPIKIGLIVGSSVIVIGGSAVAYAKYDSQFRTKLENAIPFSDQLLNSLLGPIITQNDRSVPAIKDSKEKAIESSLMRKKQERDKSSQLLTKTATEPLNESKLEISSQQKEEPLQQSSTKVNTNDNKEKSGLKEEHKELSDSVRDSPKVDIDVQTSKEELRQQLMSLMPSENETISQQEFQKRVNDIELEYQRKITKLEDKFDEESKQQLKRQLSAFNDHLQDQLATLRHELKRKHQIILEEKLLDEKSRYLSELSDSLYRLRSIEDKLQLREQLDKDERIAKELWVLTQALSDTLVHRPDISEQCSPHSLNKEIDAVKSVLKQELSDKPLVKLALESIPEEVLQNGLYSEEDLIKRFKTVDRVCKRVALIGDNGGNLFQYMISYVQSLLIFDSNKIPKEELENQEVVDPTKWDTFDVLTRIRFCLNNNDLEQALRYANQLRGEPRNVAKDWIRDIRTYLETKQAINLLQTECEAINVQVLN